MIELCIIHDKNTVGAEDNGEQSQKHLLLGKTWSPSSGFCLAQNSASNREEKLKTRTKESSTKRCTFSKQKKLSMMTRNLLTYQIKDSKSKGTF